MTNELSDKTIQPIDIAIAIGKAQKERKIEYATYLAMNNYLKEKSTQYFLAHPSQEDYFKTKDREEFLYKSIQILKQTTDWNSIEMLNAPKNWNFAPAKKSDFKRSSEIDLTP